MPRSLPAAALEPDPALAPLASDPPSSPHDLLVHQPHNRREDTGSGLRRALSCLPLALALSCSPPGSDDAAGRSAGESVAGFEGGIERARYANVLTAPLLQEEMVRAISTTVNAASESEIQVIPRTTGVVTELLVEEGDRVAAGDVLMRLDPRELQAALDEAIIAKREAEDAKIGLTFAVSEAEAQVERAQLTFDQSKRELARKEDAADVVSRNELDQLRLTVQTNEADLAAQEVARKRAEAALSSQEIAIEKATLQISRATLNLSYATVTAPFDGVIAQRDVRIGDNVTGTAMAFLLTDPDNVRAVVSRPQRELRFFRAAAARRSADAEGEAADSVDIEIFPEALPEHSYRGRILFVSPTIDAASGQFRVTLGVDQPAAGDPRPPVLPGMLLRVRIVTERHPDALVVPKRALLREGDAYFVFVADGDRARKIQVEEGFSDDDDVEILPAGELPLLPGTDIVVVGNRDLEDGDGIEAAVWPAARTAPEVTSEAKGDGD